MTVLTVWDIRFTVDPAAETVRLDDLTGRCPPFENGWSVFAGFLRSGPTPVAERDVFLTNRLSRTGRVRYMVPSSRPDGVAVVSLSAGRYACTAGLPPADWLLFLDEPEAFAVVHALSGPLEN